MLSTRNFQRMKNAFLKRLLHLLFASPLELLTTPSKRYKVPTDASEQRHHLPKDCVNYAAPQNH